MERKKGRMYSEKERKKESMLRKIKLMERKKGRMYREKKERKKKRKKEKKKERTII